MRQKGFTLIELMIVVAIIGILSMFALPAYQDYTKRTYVSEGMSLASAVKGAATEYYATAGVWPANNAEAGLSDTASISGQAVSGIGIRTGAFATLPGKSADAAGINATHIVIFFNTKIAPGAKPPTDQASNPVAVGGDQAILSLAPVNGNGSARWACLNYQMIELKWLPANCRQDNPHPIKP